MLSALGFEVEVDVIAVVVGGGGGVNAEVFEEEACSILGPVCFRFFWE